MANKYWLVVVVGDSGGDYSEVVIADNKNEAINKVTKNGSRLSDGENSEAEEITKEEYDNVIML